MTSATIPAGDLLRAAGLLNVQDHDIARVLNVPIQTVLAWRSENRLARRHAPALAALLEATWTKSMVDFTRAANRALPREIDQQLRDLATFIRAATQPIKNDPLLARKYQRIIARMLDALGRADHASRLTPRQRGLGV